jgi:hypothetical protein
MNWAPAALAPWLAACLVAGPPPSTSAPTAAPTSSASSAAEAPPTVTVAPPLEPAAPVAVEATFEPTRVAPPVRRELGAAPAEVETRSISFAGNVVTVPCSVGGRAARCVELADGPWLVSDYEALDGCPDALYLAGGTKPATSQSGLPQGELELTWTVRVTERGVQGARVAVARDAKLFAALEPRQRGRVPNARCAITWSGQGQDDAKSAPPQPALMESPYR